MNRNAPIMLVLTGSFNPPHLAHLRALELAKDYLEKQSLKVVGGIQIKICEVEKFSSHFI